MALPHDPTPRIALTPTNLPAIANAVAMIAQPPSQDGLNNSLEMRRLQDDLVRARQELRTLHEAGRTFAHRDTRSKQYLEVLPCGVLALDELGTPIYQNEPLTKLLGRPIEKDETVEQWLAAACPSEQHREEVAALWREDVWRRQLTRTFSLATADGLLKELEFQPVSLPGGGLLVSIQDATEKCRHEEQLRATEAKFRTLLQEAPIPVVLMDKTGSVFDVNHLAESLLGHPKNELRRYPLDAWLEPESSAARREALRKMQQDAHRTGSLEVHVKQTAGAPVTALLHLAQVADSDGEPHCTIHYFQKQSAAVEPAKVHTQDSVPIPIAPETAALPQIISTLLLKTNVNGRIKECSARGLALLGLTEEEALGRPLHQHFSPSDSSGFYTHLAMLSQTPNEAAELTCYSQSGERQNCRATVTPRGSDGADFELNEVVESVVLEPGSQTPIISPEILPDSTTANTLSLLGALPWPVANLDREKLLLSETHHRIKNHLQIISSLLNLESNTITDTAARNALRSSQNRVRSIADLHQHLYQLTLGTAESFTDFAQGLLEHLRECYQVNEDRVAVHFDLQVGAIEPEWLMPLALTLNETLSNSFEHAFPEGRQGEVRASLTFGGSFGELVMADNGIGLSESLRPGTGAGLGLKILAVFAEQMRGQLSLGRSDSGGTEIRLRFPIASADN
ncbi:MAG: histidine kinase dimerization/phosphoacceptor domain -containing protein [Prosthecobacter sp.]